MTQIVQRYKIKTLLFSIFTLLRLAAFGQANQNEMDSLSNTPIPYITDTTLYAMDATMPQYPNGGQQGFLNYLYKNFRYPRKECLNNIEGAIIVEFIIRKNGKVTNAKILKGISPNLNKEAIRVVMDSPKWIPGKDSGNKDSVYYRVPVTCLIKQQSMPQNIGMRSRYPGYINNGFTTPYPLNTAYNIWPMIIYPPNFFRH